MTAGVLSSEAAAVAAMVGAVAADAEKAYIDSLPDEDLFDAVATVQSELEKAKAALARKRPAPERLTSTKGPFGGMMLVPAACGLRPPRSQMSPADCTATPPCAAAMKPTGL